MTTTEFDTFRGHRAGNVVVIPTVKVGAGGTELDAVAAGRLVRVLVDLHLGMPDAFELTFLDSSADVLTRAGLKLGAQVAVAGAVYGESTTKPLVEGEVTSIEGHYGDSAPLTIVRGFSLDHRLQRVRHTRTFVDGKDSDVARQLAGDASIPVGTIDATQQRHPLLAQDNQTDWAFLRDRAQEIGYEVGVVEGKFYFRKASAAKGGAEVRLVAHENMITFSPRISGANLVPEVEVRAWDPVNAQAKAARKPVASPGVDIGAGDAATAADVFVKGGPGAPAGAGELGPAPSEKAHVVYDRAVTVDGGSTQALTSAATALAEQLASGYAEADGVMFGDPAVVAGAVLRVEGVPELFKGAWTVSRARHVFDNDAGGYRTWFEVTGRQDRSTLALAGGAGNAQGPSRIQGVVGAVVTAVDDPLGLGRVKVALPWLSPEYETSWAPVAQLTAGKSTGALFLPEAGDQVLVAFEFGDLRRPYVLGSLVNKRTGLGGVLEPGGSEPGRTAVKAGRPATVIRRGFVTPSGNRLVFHDEVPPGGGKPVASEVVLASAQDKLGLSFDAVKGQLRLSCTPGSPPGKLVIECDGEVEIKAGASGRLTVDGGQMLTLKAKTVQIEGTGPVAVKGKPIQLN